MHLDADELEALQMCPGYIAGFVDLEVSNRSDLYDVFVNLVDSEISIAPLAKEAMTMGKLHKEIGQLIVQSAEDPEKSDSQVIQVMPSSSHRRGPEKASFGNSRLSAVHVNRVK